MDYSKKLSECSPWSDFHYIVCELYDQCVFSHGMEFSPLGQIYYSGSFLGAREEVLHFAGVELEECGFDLSKIPIQPGCNILLINPNITYETDTAIFSIRHLQTISQLIPYMEPYFDPLENYLDEAKTTSDVVLVMDHLNNWCLPFQPFYKADEVIQNLKAQHCFDRHDISKCDRFLKDLIKRSPLESIESMFPSRKIPLS